MPSLLQTSYPGCPPSGPGWFQPESSTRLPEAWHAAWWATLHLRASRCLHVAGHVQARESQRHKQSVLEPGAAGIHSRPAYTQTKPVSTFYPKLAPAAPPRERIIQATRFNRRLNFGYSIILDSHESHEWGEKKEHKGRVEGRRKRKKKWKWMLVSKGVSRKKTRTKWEAFPSYGFFPNMLNAPPKTWPLCNQRFLMNFAGRQTWFSFLVLAFTCSVTSTASLNLFYSL